MFWKSKENKKDDKLAAPRGLPEIVRKYLVANPKVDAEIVPAVIKKSASPSSIPMMLRPEESKFRITIL
jgi:hypothetical protein